MKARLILLAFSLIMMDVQLALMVVMQQKMDQLKGLMDEAGRDWSELEITAMAPASARPELAQVFEKMEVNVLYGLVSATDTETPKLFSEIKQFAAAMSGRGA